MHKMLSHGAVADNNWTVLQQPVESIPAGDILVPLNYWLEHRVELKQQSGQVGVWLDSDEDFSDGYQTAADQAEPLFKRLR